MDRETGPADRARWPPHGATRSRGGSPAAADPGPDGKPERGRGDEDDEKLGLHAQRIARTTGPRDGSPASAAQGRYRARNATVGGVDMSDRTGARASEGVSARAAVAGAAAGAVALGVSELLAGLMPGAPSLVSAMGALVIALQPPGAKDLVVALFGTADKAALTLAVVGAGLALAALAGATGRHRFRWAVAVYALTGGLAAGATVQIDLAAPPAAALVAVTAVAAASGTLWLLLDIAGLRGMPGPASDAGRARQEPGAAAAAVTPRWDRRRFVLATAGAFAGAAAAGGLGRILLGRRSQELATTAPALPAPIDPAASLAPSSSLPVPGITPIVTAADEFYKIDTALTVPAIDAATWQLRVTGMVDRPSTYTYRDLLAMPLFEQYLTLACVSNEVGGDLVGNARWTGVRLKEILAAAGVRPGASQVVGRAVDGFTAGFPTSWALEPSREPMVALGMNGGPLPVEHGFPARLLVPGLFGYVSATKWLAEIELTTREAFDGYWVPLGWAKDGPILTQSRIDLPRDGERLQPGSVDVAGVAWAPDRGVSRVEVRVDDGPWQPAELSRAIAPATWVQWRLRWKATPGEHTIEERATDGLGIVQAAERTPPAPDGARGHHMVNVLVA